MIDKNKLITELDKLDCISNINYYTNNCNSHDDIVNTIEEIYEAELSAKEMFEELGFKQVLCINQNNSEHAQIKYEAVFANCIKREIYFIPKGFYAQLYHYDYEEQVFKNVGGCIIEKELLEAINQQCKELGWI